MISLCGKAGSFPPTLNTASEDMSYFKVRSSDDLEAVDVISIEKEDRRISRLKRKIVCA